MAFHFGKYDRHTGDKQQNYRLRDAHEANELDDQGNAPQKHQDRVARIRQGEVNKQEAASNARKKS
ncbi:MAG TPA: hypothetical protein VH084_28295 [Mycobacterium sp.]|nr:hypothetical protein [Mycobacterium sp.]